MKFAPMINSLLENDAYKFSMGQVYFMKHSTDEVTWTFKCRNENVKFTDEMVQEIKDQIKHYCTLRYTREELEFLRGFGWLKDSYINYLKFWHPVYENIFITKEGECGLAIEAKGNLLETSPYETPILAIVNETYFRMAYDYDKLFNSYKERFEAKVKDIGPDGELCLASFSEFGFRRRLSAEAQEYAVQKFVELKNNKMLGSSDFVGTSNVYLAMKYHTKAVGTMAHEYIMSVGQGNPRHDKAYANFYALRDWVEVYGTKNGIALTDTIGTDVFLLDFDDTYANLFSGVRHDSGDPFAWGDKMIAHYEKLGINPKTKTLLFSDSLDFKRADALYRYFKDKIHVAFGIGTYITNDTEAGALNIVMKITECNGDDVAKLSDVEGKGMCKNERYIRFLRRCIDFRMNREGGQTP